MRIKALHLLLILGLGMISSCSEKQTIKYFYSDGSEIKDTATIAIARAEFESLNIKSEKSILVKTSFRSNIHLEKFLKSVQAEFISTLKTQRPKQVQYIDSVPPDHFFNIGIIVMENASGKIVYQREPKNKERMSQLMEIGMTSRLLGFILTMKKGASAEDSFLTQPSFETLAYTESGEKRTWKFDGMMPLKKLFWYEPSSAFLEYPYHNYTYADWANLKAQLEIEMFIAPKHGEIGCYVHTTFRDFTNVFALLHNDGIKAKSRSVLSVKDNEGKSLYVSKKSVHQAVSKHISSEMLKLLDATMADGYGQSAKKELNLDEKCHILSGRNARDLGWILFTNGKITIGIINCGQNKTAIDHKNENVKKNYKVRKPHLFYPILKRLFIDFS